MTRRKSGICDGLGHPGGPKRFRVCPRCEVEKPTSAFRGLHEECMKCVGDCRIAGNIRYGSRMDQVLLGPSRCSFDAWMEGCGADAEDYVIVRQALARYGLRGPTADEVLDDAVGGLMTFGQRFHAVVLMASEAKMLSTREMRRKAAGRTNTKRSAA